MERLRRYHRFLKKSTNGNVGELMTTGICVMAITMLLVSYYDCVGLIQQKIQMGQLARGYILEMETDGYLTPQNEENLKADLAAIGVSDVELGNTTMQSKGFGERIELIIRGKIRGKYEVEEYRVSTAKN